jgi:hypothetical protein
MTDRVGSSTDPNLNGHLKYPNNLDQSLNDAVADKIRNNRPPTEVSFMPAIASTSSRFFSRSFLSLQENLMNSRSFN